MCGFLTSSSDVKQSVSIKIALSSGMYVMSGFDPRILILLMKMIYVGKITLTPHSVGIVLDSLVSPESEVALKYHPSRALPTFSLLGTRLRCLLADSVFLWNSVWMTETFGTRDTEYQALFLIRSYRSRRPLPYYEKKKKESAFTFHNSPSRGPGFPNADRAGNECSTSCSHI